MSFLPILEGFEWDEGNLLKNWLKHNVLTKECEEIFFSKPLLIYPDQKHSDHETRYVALGQTSQGRRLTIIFTIRKNLIRVISARDQNKKEREAYEEDNEEKT